MPENRIALSPRPLRRTAPAAPHPPSPTSRDFFRALSLVPARDALWERAQETASPSPAPQGAWNRLFGAALCTLMCTGVFAAPAAHADPQPGAAAPAKTSAARDGAAPPKNTGDGGAKKVTAQDVIDLALKQVGITENAYGGGTKFHEWYMSSPRARETLNRDGGRLKDYANAPWCAMFVSWLAGQLGIESTMGWDAYTVTHAAWFRDNGRWGTTKASPGAVVFFDWNGSKDIDHIDHVGIVIKDNGDGTITTVEGNTGNGRVETRVRPKSVVVGYGYPEYAEE